MKIFILPVLEKGSTEAVNNGYSPNSWKVDQTILGPSQASSQDSIGSDSRLSSSFRLRSQLHPSDKTSFFNFYLTEYNKSPIRIALFLINTSKMALENLEVDTLIVY